MNFSELRRIVKTAKKAGIETPEERRMLLTRTESAHPLIEETLTPEAIIDLLERLSGHQKINGRKYVFILGNALYQLEKRLAEASRGVPIALEKGDHEMFDKAVQLLEEALFSGRLAHLSEEDAAMLAFLANRLGKIKERSRDTSLAHMDPARMHELAAHVTAFAEDELRDERVDQLIEQAREKRDAALEERRTSEDPQIVAYDELFQKEQDLVKKIEEAADLERADKDFEERARFIDEVLPLLHNNMEIPAIVFHRLQDIANVYKFNKGSEIVRRFLKEEKNNPFFLLRLQFEQRGVRHPDEADLWAAGHTFDQAAYNLQLYIEDRKKAAPLNQKQKGKGFAALKGLDPENQIPKLQKVQKILEMCLRKNNSDGILGEVQNLTHEKRKVANQRHFAFVELKTNAEFLAIQNKLVVATTELQSLEETRKGLPTIRALFQHSRDRVILNSKSNRNTSLNL